MAAKQKKLITLNEFELINDLIRDEAQSVGITESEQIERILIQHYLNVDKDMAFAVRKLLYGDNGISRCLAYVFSLSNKLTDVPRIHINSLLDFVYGLELRYRTRVEGVNDPRVRQLIDFSGELADIVKPVDSFYAYKMFDNIHELEEEIDAFNTGTEFAQVFKIMKQFWDVPIPSKYLGGLDIYLSNLQISFDVMRLICEISSYPTYPEYRSELVRILKNFKFE